ncbi:hypothetical protein ACWC09_25245, partial [Streptomyces sp. NPDC001617]
MTLLDTGDAGLGNTHGFGDLDLCGVLPLPQLGEAVHTSGQDHRLRPLLDLVLFGISASVKAKSSARSPQETAC